MIDSILTAIWWFDLIDRIGLMLGWLALCLVAGGLIALVGYGLYRIWQEEKE